MSETIFARSPPRQYSDSWFEPFPEGESATSTSALPHLGSDSSTSLLRGNALGSTGASPIFRASRSPRIPASRTLKNDSDVLQTNQDEENLQEEEHRLRRHRNWAVFITNPQILRALCLNLHIGLVLLHCVLLGISLSHLENRKVIPLGRQSTAWSIGIPALSQAFITVYSAGILVLTQQLSLRRNLLVRQTLTATHDKTTAWNGLGSALLSLWRQISVTASIWGVAFIMIYLAGISVLHISTPTLLTLESFNNTIQTNLTTTRALPNPDVDTLKISTNPVQFGYFAQAAPILPLMGQYSQLSTIGVHGSTVYDMLPDNQGRGNVSVNATRFEVHCDVLPNPRVTGSTSSKWNITTDPLRVEGGMYFETGSFQVPLISPNVVRVPRLDPFYEDRVIFYSSVNFTDSQGGNGSRITLNPPMIANEGASIVYSLQVMACRFFSSNSTIYVDSQTKFPVDPPQQKTTSTWGAVQPSPRFKNTTELATIASFNVVLHYVSTIRGTLTATRCAVLSECDYFTVIDQFLVQQLGLKPDIDPRNDPQPHPQMQLYQLENALANLTAALHWSTTQLKPEKSSSSTLFNMAFFGQATVSQPQLASRLKLNVIPISVGLGASIILLIASVLLVGRHEAKADAVDSTGILHLIWLLRDRPDLQNRLARVESPSTEYLRTAGMFEVRLAGEFGSVNHEMTSR